MLADKVTTLISFVKSSKKKVHMKIPSLMNFRQKMGVLVIEKLGGVANISGVFHHSMVESLPPVRMADCGPLFQKVTK